MTVKDDGKHSDFLHTRYAKHRADTVPGAKRKAEEEPSSPSASKRIKQDQDATEEVDRKAMKPIPFPEKVRRLTLIPTTACS
jgi:hypothetical protein